MIRTTIPFSRAFDENARMSTQQTAYPLFTAKGDARELGRQHGAQARPLIREFLDWLQASLKLSRPELERRALVFRPVFERYCPHLIEEIDGLAEGAGLTNPEALALQLRGELGCVADTACTTFVISPRGTAERETLIGQNSDTPPIIERVGYVLHLRPADRPEILIWTFGGMLGYHGVNRLGVGHFANALGGGPEWKLGLSHYPVKRMMLECHDLTEVRKLLQSVPVCSNGNYVLCDGAGQIADVELTSAGPHEIDDGGAGFIAHSNHFLCAPHACRENFNKGLADSFPRLERMRQLIAGKFGTIALDDVRGFLSDHAGHPVSICRHPHDGPDHAMLESAGKTAASLIAEPAKGLLHVSRGNPCTEPFTTYRMDGLT
jgi:isopenicillin-N N-acyltransferase-like protein